MNQESKVLAGSVGTVAFLLAGAGFGLDKAQSGWMTNPPASLVNSDVFRYDRNPREFSVDGRTYFEVLRNQDEPHRTVICSDKEGNFRRFVVIDAKPAHRLWVEEDSARAWALIEAARLPVEPNYCASQ